MTICFVDSGSLFNCLSLAPERFSGGLFPFSILTYHESDPISVNPGLCTQAHEGESREPEIGPADFYPMPSLF